MSFLSLCNDCLLFTRQFFLLSCCVGTGSSAADEQMASMAEPKDPSDPMLREWTKYKQNPILRPPPPVLIRDFRDPTTAWKGPDGVWRLAVGSKIGRAGVALLYKSKDLYNWEYQGEHHLLHAVAGTGMWECVDFYPVGPLGEPTPDISAHGPGVKHVMKVSLDDERHDWYALGHYDTDKDIFVPDNPLIDVGIGLRYNYGKFYASKSFIDPVKQRRIIWGFVNESDPEVYDLAKGWNTVMVSISNTDEMSMYWSFFVCQVKLLLYAAST